MIDLQHNSKLTNGLITAAVLGYFLPWLISGSISLTLGAYDLAEWISLRLPVRPMDTVLLVRAIPVLMAVLIGLNGSHFRRWSVNWWLSAGAVILFAIALLPPFEFFLDSNQRGDMNYSQQFQLAGAALVMGLFALTGLLRRIDALLMLIIGVGIIALTLLGLSQIWPMMVDLGLTPQIGLGPFVLVAASLILCIAALPRTLKLVQSARPVSTAQTISAVEL